MDPNLPKNSDSKRLFFGAEVEAPWPKDYPHGRLIPEDRRHITLAFLGQQSFSHLKEFLPSIPRPSFQIGPVGIAEKLLFLPHENHRVVALRVQWFEPKAQLDAYQRLLSDWLKSHGYQVDERPFFPHITLARLPFDKQEWSEHFEPLPFYVKAIRLYQSLGNLQYEPLWQIDFLPPFEELEHTADLAFLIRGKTLGELHFNAQCALAFKFPELIPFFRTDLQDSLEELIISLNQVISHADATVGCSLKAVSFHGKIQMDERNLLSWEMIVDV
jgi:2'-5' RNA ligase